MKKTHAPARRRPRDHLLRRDRRRRPRARSTPATCPRHRPRSEIRYDALLDEWVAIAVAPPGPHLPAADRRVPAVPVHATAGTTEIPAHDYDVVVFENRFPSFATTVADVAPDDGAQLCAGSPGCGRCEVVCFTSDHDSVVLPTVAGAGPHRRRGVGRPHHRALRAPARRAGVLLREPRRGDRRHARPSARPDLRLPVRHAAHARRCSRARERTASAPAATCSPTCWPPSRPTARGS